MKKILHYSRLAVWLLFTTSVFSCKKSFLEIKPKGKTIAQTTNDYNLLLNNYDLFNIDADAQAAMGDEIAAVEPYFSGTDLRTQRLFRWDAVIYEPQQNANEMAVPMRNIYNYNKIINEVLNAAEGTDQQKKSLQAEAMAGRAWTYFLLINYYGKPFNNATSSTDPGFPIITTADVTQTKFTRASVKDVYDFIIKDLTTAIPALPAQTTHRLRMSKAAAEGILGKVYTFMGRFSDALPQLNAAITDMASAAIPVGLYDYNVNFGPGGSFLPISFFGPTYPTIVDDKENLYGKQFINYWTFISDEFVINPQTVALYDPADLRLNFYANTPAFGGNTYPGGMLRRTGPAGIQFGVQVPDLYLLRAECKARLNDLPGAKADVEALRVNRMPSTNASVPTAIASDQKALVKFILEERIREFAVEGFRWFDMRRLSVDPDFSATVGNVHNVYSSSGQVTQTLTLKPERLVLRFPQKLMNQNPGMENNP
ncbi:MAG: RagB/SusD family nutrient uptake outer membrane protein [Chitinophaga sp.]|uniref:RagB/SusD family nutrient uptake outer membrane protein n=1 Tax=Chitinophaga sp. TaxID=1869181 RepID=UPI0025C13A7D|nr:RagB/SusD family nutrient uptake outer membrane protein [Chitinophaga sp.]MBV8251518.1 RagB/SusD family nutrient uptake outer membrane protein [Chitinophaga sp.]